MTYEKIFTDVKKAFIKADLKKLNHDFAYQFNIIGSGEGIFYVAYKNSVLDIQPYDYVDRNGTLYAEGDIFIRIANGVLSFDKAVREGFLRIEGNSKLAYEIGKLSRDKTEAGKKIDKAETAEALEEKSSRKKDRLPPDKAVKEALTKKPFTRARKNDIKNNDTDIFGEDEIFADFNTLNAAEAANFANDINFKF